MVGKTLGHYEILEPLGAGGMGEVYRARDTKLKRDVAIKVLPPEMASDEQRLGRLQREAQLLASLNHPNIAAIYGLEEAEGSLALVLELVEGPTLEHRLAAGGGLPVEEAAAIALQISEALEAAHEQGIIHRDLKPANVKVAEGEGGMPIVKVLDFGLAKSAAPIVDASGSAGEANAPADSPTLSLAATQAGLIIGTAAYMSPEQAKGKPADRRADIWSFGIVLYEMIAGRRVFDGETVSEVLAAVILKEIDWDVLPAATPAALRVLLERCLTRDPRRRLRDIGEARLALDDFLEDAGDLVTRAEEIKTQKAASRQQRRELRGTADPGWGRIAAGFILGLAVFYAISTVWPSGEAPEVTRVNVSLVEAVDPNDENAFQPKLETTAGPPFALSPDGRRVAYVTTGVAGRNTLWVRELDELESRELAQGELLHPFFSPDGNWIGFFDGTELRKVAVAGGSSRFVTDVALLNRGASWADDGYIVYSPGVTHPIFRVPENGGEGEPITELDETQPQGHRFPAVLPGGRVVVYTSGRPGEFGDAVVRAIDLDSGRDVELVGGIFGRYLETGHLAYVVGGTLFVDAFDVETLQLAGRPSPAASEIAFNLGNAAAQYAVSANGSLMYLVGDMTTVAKMPIFAWPLDPAEGAQLMASENNYMNPRVSPDGTALAYSIGTQARSDLHIRSQSGAEVRITFGNSGNNSATWSPDGTYIYYRAMSQGTATFGENIWRKRADGVGDEEQITFESADHPRDFHPDGSALLLRHNDETTAIDLMVLRFENGDPVGEPEPFVSGPVRDDFGRFSPDGRWVAYHSTENGGRLDVFVTPYPDGDTKYQISTNGGAFPLWSHDGSTIYFQGTQEIFAVDVRVEGEALVRDAPRSIRECNCSSNLQEVSNWDIDPSGEFFYVINQPLQTSGIEAPVLVLNWFEDVKKIGR